MIVLNVTVTFKSQNAPVCELLESTVLHGFDFRLWFRLAKSTRITEKTGTLTASQRAISGMVFNKPGPCCLKND